MLSQSVAQVAVGLKSSSVGLVGCPARLPDPPWSVAAQRDSGDHRQMVAAEVCSHRPRAAAREVSVTEDCSWSAGVAAVAGTGV